MRSIGQIKSLYSKIYFSKRSLILIFLCILSIVVMAYSSLNLGFTEGEFLFLRDDYINEYIKSSYNFCLIINSVIIPILFLAELKEEVNSVNLILIPRVKRIRIQISKILIMLEISFVICAIEVMIIGIIPCINYPYFNLEIDYLLIGLYLFLYTFLSTLILNTLLKFIKLFVIGAFPILLYLLINIFKDESLFVKNMISLDTVGQSLTSCNCIYFLLGVIVAMICIYMV